MSKKKPILSELPEQGNSTKQLLGSVYSPNNEDKWRVIAIDIYGRIFLETEIGSIHFYEQDAFDRAFCLIN